MDAKGCGVTQMDAYGHRRMGMGIEGCNGVQKDQMAQTAAKEHI